MSTARTCSHIKINGVKCGSPALRHQTLCYFHYQWDRRERRRLRLGGPVGLNKNTGIELPILEDSESIMLAIMEVQRALLDARIDRHMAHTLLYSLQLAIQVKLHSGLSNKHNSVPTCPELDQELELDRARGLRPQASECQSCRSKHTCTKPCHPERSAAVPRGAEGPSVSLSNSPNLASCHPERSAAVPRGVEGPFVSSPEATALDITQHLANLTNSLRDCSPARECGETIANIQASRAPTRRQITIPANASRDIQCGATFSKRPFSDPALKGGAEHESSLRD